MRVIPCVMEVIRTEAEDFWEVTVPGEYASEAALEFAALSLGRAEKIVFADKTQCFTVRSDSVTLGLRTIAVDKDWLESVWCLFLDAHRSGWTITAHVDQDFSDKNGGALYHHQTRSSRLTVNCQLSTVNSSRRFP